jgi:enoyl-CoA hydratase/carnithine racemase
MPELTRDGEVFVLDLGAGENRIDPDWIAGVAAALDEVEAADPPRGLVTTGSGRFFSMGLDLDWMAANPGGIAAHVNSMHELFARMLELPLPTVAALQRHTLAGGALFALTHDHRVMRADRGWFSLPEVDVAIAFSPGLTDLVAARLAPQVAHEALTGGRRYGGEEAVEAGIVDAAVPADAVVPRAIQIARGLSGKDPAAYGTIKARLYRRTLASLRDTEANALGPEQFRAAFEIVSRATG